MKCNTRSYGAASQASGPGLSCLRSGGRTIRCTGIAAVAMAEPPKLRDLAFSFLRSVSPTDPSSSSSSSSHGMSSVEDKISLLRYFHDVFLRLGDVEGQLVLRHEILLLCEKSRASSVDLDSWMAFADDCLASGFVNNALKAYEKVSTCLHLRQNAEDNTDRQSSHLTKTLALLKLRLMKNASAGIATQTSSENLPGSRFQMGSDECVSYAIPMTVTSRYMVGIKQREKARLQTFGLRRIKE